MELTLVPLLLALIEDEFGLSISQLAWVFNSYGFSVAVGVIAGGWLGDAFNAKRVFAFGVLFFALGSAIVASAGSFEMILAGRVLQGFGGGVFSPLVPLLLTKAAPEKPGKVLIVWGSIVGYVAAFAPLTYSTFLAESGWRIAFIVFSALAICALAIMQKAHLPDDPQPRPAAASRYASLLEVRELWAMFGYVFCTYGAITFFLFRLPLWLAEKDYETSTIGLFLSLMWLSFSVVSTLLRNRVDEPSVGRILLAAPVFIASGFPLAYFHNEAILVFVAPILIGCGLACSNAPSTQAILRFAPPGTTAISASLDITFARLGGVATVTFLAQAHFLNSYASLVFMCIAATLCAASITKSLTLSIRQ